MFFRDASQLQDERTASIWEIQARYDANFDSWFDGTPDSIDRRLAQCNRLLQRYSSAIAVSTSRPDLNRDRLAGVLAGVDELREDRRSLEALRHDILTAGVYRDA
jgi:hypothetical protein